jgi:phosphatidylglycerophosphatase C
MKKNLALFDFDGTLTTHDSLLQILRFHKGNLALKLQLLVFFPIMALTKLRLWPAQHAKEQILTWAFGGMTEADFQQVCNRFCGSQLAHIIRPEALKKLQWHMAQDDMVCIVSASPQNWILPWATQYGIQVISTQLEINQGRVTGKIDGKNCNGAEKVVRIKQHFNLTDFNVIFAYGDTTGDADMLAIAHQKFFRRF